MSNQLENNPAKIAELEQQVERGLWALMRFPIMRYLMANTKGRLNGAEKAERHMELSALYCEVKLDLHRDNGDADGFRIGVHDATQAMTSHMDERIGFPVNDTHPDYDTLAPQFFTQFLELADSYVELRQRAQDALNRVQQALDDEDPRAYEAASSEYQQCSDKLFQLTN